MEEATGFTLEKDAAPAAMGAPILNKAEPVTGDEKPVKNPGKSLAETLEEALETAMVEAMAKELVQNH